MERRREAPEPARPVSRAGDRLLALALGAAGLVIALVAGLGSGGRSPSSPPILLAASAAGRSAPVPAIPRRTRFEPAGPAGGPVGTVSYTGSGGATSPTVAGGLAGLSGGRVLAAGEIEVGPLLVGLDQGVGRAYPPDVQVAVGPSAIVELVNTAGRIWDRTGAVQSTFGLQDVVDRPGDLLSDPRILFDTVSGRWLATVMDVSRLEVDLVVSQTTDPMGGWYRYALPADGLCPDQPKVGVADTVVTVTANLFDATACRGDVVGSPSFVGSRLWVVNKAQLLAGSPTWWQVFGPYAELPGLAPAQSLAGSPTAYLVSAGSDRSTSSLAMVATTGTPPGPVTLARWSVPVAPLQAPPQSRQAGSTVLLDAGDLRVHDAAYRDGILALAVSEGCLPPGDVLMEPCARVVRISVADRRVTADGRIGIPGMGVLYPALRPDGAGNLDVVVGFSSPTNDPSLAVAVLGADGTWSDGPRTLAAGVGPVLNVPPGEVDSRYGDYFGAAVDPADPSRVWVAGELGGAGGSWATVVSWIRSSQVSGSGATPSPSLSPTPSPEPSPTASPSPTAPVLFTVTQGEPATLRVTGPPSTPATLEASADGQAWAVLTVVTTDAAGGASYTFVPTATAFYRVTFPGEAPVPLGQGVVLPPETTAVRLASGRSVLTWGEGLTLTVRLAWAGAADGRPVEILASRDGVAWNTVATVTTGPDGTASLAYRPVTNLWYRAVVAGTPDLPAGTSPAIRVVVRQVALLRPTNGGTVRTVLRGTTVTFTVTVRPTRPELGPARVTFVAFRWVGGRWTLVAQIDRTTDASGQATWAWRFSSVGSWFVRALANPTPFNANSVWSPPERYDVR